MPAGYLQFRKSCILSPELPEKWLVAVNYSDHQSQCYLTMPWDARAGQQWQLRDRMGTAFFERDGEELAARGLYLDMPAWAFHIFEIHTIGTEVDIGRREQAKGAQHWRGSEGLLRPFSGCGRNFRASSAVTDPGPSGIAR